MGNKERPILFSTDMVVSILEDRKTKTRRMNGLSEINEHPEWYWPSIEMYDDEKGRLCQKMFSAKGNKIATCSYGQPGDLLWVRETWAMETAYQGHAYWYLYKTAYDSPVAWTWKPSIHMPKDAARIWLQITDIRVERVQTISTSDAISEGIKSKTEQKKSGRGLFYKDYCNANDWYWSAKASFMSLWQKINGRKSWRANPWVWVISFKVISKTGRPLTITSGVQSQPCIAEGLKSSPSGKVQQQVTDAHLLPGTGEGKEVANG